MPLSKPCAVLSFWFETLNAGDWFRENRALDQEIAACFGATHAAAVNDQLAHWRGDAAGRLAEIIVLDQFSRNIYRRDPRAFAADDRALALAREAITAGADRVLEPARRAFIYMPYMHSESLAVHADARRLFDQPGLEKERHAEDKHYAILQRFGRYPHRNPILGRTSTTEELMFLSEPGSSF